MKDYLNFNSLCLKKNYTYGKSVLLAFDA